MQATSICGDVCSVHPPPAALSTQSAARAHLRALHHGSACRAAPHALLLRQVQQRLVLLGAQRARLCLHEDTGAGMQQGSESGDVVERQHLALLADRPCMQHDNFPPAQARPHATPHLVLLARHARVPSHPAVGAQLLLAAHSGTGAFRRCCLPQRKTEHATAANTSEQLSGSEVQCWAKPLLTQPQPTAHQ